MQVDKNKFKQAREAAHKSRAEIAKAAGITHVRVWQIETEGISQVNDAIVKAMCDEMGCDPANVAV